LQKLWGGYSVGLGIEKSNHKRFIKGFSLELFCSRDGVFYERSKKLFINPTQSLATQNFVGTKLGLFIF
jgi:hypothetical protein